MSASKGADLSGVISNPFIWVIACSVLAVIVIQSAIYMLAVHRNARAAGLSHSEANKAFRIGAVSAIGPSLAVVLIAVALLPLLGTPAVLVRIGLIGSAATELASASIAAQTMGTELGGAAWNSDTFVVALAAMSLSGAGWMLATLILTPLMQRGQTTMQRVNPVLFSLVPSAALLGAFAALSVQQVTASMVHFFTWATSAVIMGIALFIAHRFKQSWLKEWALGFALIGGVIVAYFVHNHWPGL